MIIGFPTNSSLMLAGVAGEALPAGEVVPDGFGAMLAIAMGPGVAPEIVGDARSETEPDALDASGAVVAVLPDPVVPVPVAVQAGDAAVPGRADDVGNGVRARPDRGEAAALLRAGMVTASLPARLVLGVVAEAVAEPVAIVGPPADIEVVSTPPLALSAAVKDEVAPLAVQPPPAVATPGEIGLPIRRLRGNLPEVLPVLQGLNGAQPELDGRSALREATVEMVASVGSAAGLPGFSGGNAVVRGVSETRPAVALPEAAPVLSVKSAALGLVSIGVEGGEQDLRVSLSGSSAAAASMSAEAPRLLAELAANGVRVQSLAIEGQAEPTADAAGQGGVGPGAGQQGASQSGSERGRPGVAAPALMRLPDPPARSRISERYA